MKLFGRPSSAFTNIIHDIRYFLFIKSINRMAYNMENSVQSLTVGKVKKKRYLHRNDVTIIHDRQNDRAVSLGPSKQKGEQKEAGKPFTTVRT